MIQALINRRFHGPATTIGRLATSDATIVRRIGMQLAALLVALLCLLLGGMLVVVYYRTSSEALASVHATLRARADMERYHITDSAANGGRKALRESTREERERGEVFIIFADAHLSVLGAASGPFGQGLADPAAAAAALRSGKSRFTTQHTGTTSSYVIYTEPVFRDGHALGVVQTGISERPYEDNMYALLRSLLLVSALGLVAAAAITALVVRRALHPIRVALGHQRDFVADAAHELRTPLTIVRTAAELWLDPGSQEDQQAAVEQVLVQTNHLARLVDDLSLLARADSGVVSIARERVDFAALTAEIVEGMTLLAEEGGQRLTLDTSAAYLEGDASRLRQLLVILLDNAIKYTPHEGSISVRLAAQRGHVLLEVRDSGPGIAPHDLPQLFDRFYRADRARGGEGAGLGLAIARWIVQAHRGQIRVSNAPDGGAIFTVTLPAIS